MSFSPVQKHKEEIKAINVDGENIEVMCFHELKKYLKQKVVGFLGFPKVRIYHKLPFEKINYTVNK